MGKRFSGGGRIPILSRNNVRGQGKYEHRDIKEIEDKISYPYAQLTPYYLVQFYFDLHEKKGIKPDREFKTYFRQAKKFINKFGDESVEQLIKADQIARRQFSFNFAEEV